MNYDLSDKLCQQFKITWINEKQDIILVEVMILSNELLTIKLMLKLIESVFES